MWLLKDILSVDQWIGVVLTEFKSMHVCMCMCVCVYVCSVAQSASSLQPLDCGPPGSSVHGISQARMLEWVAISFSRGSSQPRGWTCISCISHNGRWILYLAGGFFTTWATWEAQEIGIGSIFHVCVCVCVCVVKNKRNSLGGLEVISFSCLLPNRRKTRLATSYYLEAPPWCDYCVPETASLMTLERELAQGLGALLSWQSALPWPMTRRPSQFVSHTW